MSDYMLRVNKTVNAPIENVFDAWLSPELLSQFILPMPGMPKPDVKTDAKQGGGFTIVMHVGDTQVPHTGEYLEINRPNKLVFTWQSPFSVDGSTVTIDFKKIDNNTTAVELTHIKFIDEESRSNHEAGWANILQMLDHIVTDKLVA